jgi:hypothetical protein
MARAVRQDPGVSTLAWSRPRTDAGPAAYAGPAASAAARPLPPTRRLASGRLARRATPVTRLWMLELLKD